MPITGNVIGDEAAETTAWPGSATISTASMYLT
jgi:hypothetical protein